MIQPKFCQFLRFECAISFLFSSSLLSLILFFSPCVLASDIHSNQTDGPAYSVSSSSLEALKVNDNSSIAQKSRVEGPSPSLESESEESLQKKMLKLALMVLAVIFLLGVGLYGFKRTPMFKHMVNQPVKIISMLNLTNKAKLVVVEMQGVQLLLGVTDHTVSLLKQSSDQQDLHQEQEGSSFSDPPEDLQEIFDEKFSAPP